MESVSTRLDDETVSDIRETAEERDVSMAEVIRGLIEQGQDYERLKAETERLRREKRLILEEREEKQELVKYAESERQLKKKKDHANLLKRAKWWFTGVPDE